MGHVMMHESKHVRIVIPHLTEGNIHIDEEDQCISLWIFSFRY